MICQFCGKQVGDNDKICKYCGSSLVRPAVNNNYDVKHDNNVKNIETSETETYKPVQSAGRTNRRPVNTNLENNADMTVAIPKIDGRGSGFENSRAAEETGISGNEYQGGRNRRQSQPVKTRIRKRKRIRADRISSFMLIIIMKVKELRSLLQKDIRENL